MLAKSVPWKLSFEMLRCSDGEAGQSPSSPALRSELDEGEDLINEIRSRGARNAVNEEADGDGRRGGMGNRESPCVMSMGVRAEDVGEDVGLHTGDTGPSVSGLVAKPDMEMHTADAIARLFRLLSP